MLSRASLIPTLALLCLAGPAARAQEGVGSRPASWGVWGGLAQNSPTHLWGSEGGRDLAVLALRWVRPLTATGRVEWDYVLDLVPGAWLSMPRAPAAVPPGCERTDPTEGCPYPAFADAAAVYGLGLAPLGVQGRLRAVPGLQAYLSVSAGLLRFARPVPVVGGARLNFTADVGGRVVVGRPGRLGLVVGYKFYHVSNAGTAARNPGLDGHMLVFGLQRTP